MLQGTAPPTAVVHSSLRPVVVDESVRLGRDYDGGYIVPKVAVDAAGGLVSMGILLDWSFELDFARLRPDALVRCYDKTTNLPFAIYWASTRTLGAPISGKPHHWQAWRLPGSYLSFFVLNQRVQLIRKFVARETGPEQIAVSEVLAGFPGDQKLILKIDIEGAEFEILDDVERFADRISALVIEFHDLNRRRSEFLELVQSLKRHFLVTHVHANNLVGTDRFGHPDLLEITFTHRDLLGDRHEFSGAAYRSELDMPNSPNLPDLELSFSDV